MLRVIYYYLALLGYFIELELALCMQNHVCSPWQSKCKDVLVCDMKNPEKPGRVFKKPASASDAGRAEARTEEPQTVEPLLMP